MLLVELARGAKIRLSALGAVAVVVFVGAVHLQGSLSDFHSGGVQLAKNARTWFAAADALGTKVPYGSKLAVNIVQLPAEDYALLRRDMGSLAPKATLADLGDEGTRQAADAWMVSGLGVQIIPGQGSGVQCRPAPGVLGSTGSGLPSGAEVQITTHGTSSAVRLRRFAAGFSLNPIGTVGASQAAHFIIPRDNSALPWYVQVTGDADVSVCQP